jgi:dihydrofolate synthase/folylpolyglutamate synthase
MNYDEALQYLLSLGHEMLAMKLGLANVERLLDALGRPQEKFPAVQIAGTNGKGSVAAMLDRISRAARIKTGLYTSPHLISVTERIRIAGQEISRERFAVMATTVRAACEEIERETGALPTFFEQLTAAALLAFREEQVELAILETGLGGRLDATTAARASMVAITPVALDHQEYLGSTLPEIAAEKAAIIRPGVAAVIGRQAPEVAALIRQRAAACNVEPLFAAGDIEIVGACAEGRLRVDLRTARDVYRGVCLSLRGRHQAENAALAVHIAERLDELGFTVRREQIIEGLEHAEHAGRLELRRDRSTGLALLFDGAHNAAGARALRTYLDEFVAAPITLVFGAMRDKQLGEIAATLFPAARSIILTRPLNARAASLEALTGAVPPSLDSGTITLAPTAAEALQIARETTPAGGLVCITGSLYLVGEIQGLLES